MGVAVYLYLHYACVEGLIGINLQPKGALISIKTEPLIINSLDRTSPGLYFSKSRGVEVGLDGGAFSTSGM